MQPDHVGISCCDDQRGDKLIVTKHRSFHIYDIPT